MPQHIKILSVNTSANKDTGKQPDYEVNLADQGLVGDAHSDPYHHRVSLLGKESLDRFSKIIGRDPAFGEFGENLTTEGMELISTSPLGRFTGEHLELEVTQTGIECHGSTRAVFEEVGQYTLPKEGIFARVIKPGKLKPGDVLHYHPRIWRIQVITLSDRASIGVYTDRSGPRVTELLKKHFESKSRQIHVTTHIIADDAGSLKTLINEALSWQADVIITTGGTGVGYRDITVDTIRPMLSLEIPGIMEMIRIKYGASKPNALLSRSMAGFIDRTLIYTLPGSIRAVNEYMEEILKTLEHLLYMRYGLDAH